MKRSSSILVGRLPITSHLDPLSAAPKRNSFLKSVVPFLKRVSRGPAS